MKLLVISAAYPPHRSGEATNAFYLCQNLANRGVDVHVLTTQGSAIRPHPRITLHAVMKHWSWLEMPRMSRVLKECAPDAVLLIYIGWVYQYEFMVTFAPTVCKELLPGVPFVTRFENAMGADPRRTSAFARIIRKWMARRKGDAGVDYCYGTLLRDSDRVIVLSERHRGILEQITAHVSAKSVLIPPPANMKMSLETRESARRTAREQLGLDPDAFVITYIGFLHSGKGIESLLHAFARVSQKRSCARLVLMGGAIASESGNPASYVDSLHALTDKLGIRDRVVWTGEYSWESEDTSVRLRGSDLCVLPFGQGVHLNNSSFASVAAHGVPVITTRGEILEQQFVHGENVFLCPPNSPPDLAAAMETVMEDATLRQRLQSGVEKLALEWFSWDRAIDRTMAACSLAS
jgi:glycosyltransferase involved in cell wall biosynthesis